MYTVDDTRGNLLARVRGPRWLIAAEIAVTAGMIGAVLWDVHERLGSEASEDWICLALGLAAGAAVVFSFVHVRETLPALGLSPRQWGAGWVSAGIFTAGSLALLAAAGFLWDEPGWEPSRWKWLARYLRTVVFQQALLQCFLNNRLYYLFRPLGACAAAGGSALLFAALHAPNPYLVACSGAAGAFWCFHWRRSRNIAALLASHALLGAAAMYFLGQGLLDRLRVGA